MTEDSRISKPTSGQIECPVRAIIVEDGKILLCRPINSDYYFLPGGHVEFGDTSDSTIKREILEELGVEAKSVKPLAFVDNIYEGGEYAFKRHEVNLMYEVALASKEFQITEKHIGFDWINLQDIGKTKILPAGIKDLLLQRFGK